MNSKFTFCSRVWKLSETVRTFQARRSNVMGFAFLAVEIFYFPDTRFFFITSDSVRKTSDLVWDLAWEKETDQ